MKVLIIHASFGSGHKRAAQAVLEEFEQRGIAAELRDLLEFLPAPMSRFYSSAYKFMITSSRGLWRLTYKLVNAPKGPYRPATAVTQKWQFSKLKKFLNKCNFSHVIATHFTPAALLTDWRSMKELNSGIFSIITDHEAHRCWRRTRLDHYFVASSRVSREMQQIGVPEKDITISGIPISKAFSAPLSREETRKSWNLPEQEKVILVLCSALTFKKSVEMLQEFAALNADLRYLVVAGADAKKEKRLRQRFAEDTRFIIFGFTSRIAEMMSAADLIVTKPGGLSVSESLAMGLPQILLEPIPGQEEANARFAVEEGSAICVNHKPGIYKDTLFQIISDRAKLEQMSEAARRAGHPRAAGDVVETILSKFVV
ncbi:glycosyltransferase [bacterium]|nr:glycosyltransferase [bacterium]